MLSCQGHVFGDLVTVKAYHFLSGFVVLVRGVLRPVTVLSTGWLATVLRTEGFEGNVFWAGGLATSGFRVGPVVTTVFGRGLIRGIEDFDEIGALGAGWEGFVTPGFVTPDLATPGFIGPGLATLAGLPSFPVYSPRFSAGYTPSMGIRSF